jgi:hypothetical protein
MRSHKPSQASRQTHYFAMAQASAAGPLRRQAHRCPQCRYHHQHGQVQCQVCQVNAPVVHIDEAMAQDIYEQRRVQLGRILPLKHGQICTPIPDHLQPDRIPCTPPREDLKPQMSPTLAHAGGAHA